MLLTESPTPPLITLQSSSSYSRTLLFQLSPVVQNTPWLAEFLGSVFFQTQFELLFCALTCVCAAGSSWVILFIQTEVSIKERFRIFDTYCGSYQVPIEACLENNINLTVPQSPTFSALSLSHRLSLGCTVKAVLCLNMWLDDITVGPVIWPDYCSQTLRTVYI